MATGLLILGEPRSAARTRLAAAQLTGRQRRHPMVTGLLILSEPRSTEMLLGSYSALNGTIDRPSEGSFVHEGNRTVTSQS
ncbi:hypothetical protein NDU88_001114 [Pleurodeles waltl]|uniref:Uncharacterized protein n=1 Tax=Pleurodeles waltl TaxID=8319 RepID=A0AAV7R9A4_PLEWA|nr:hypothetical protein NDU88_001114 [Pleurodeles waltl]